MDALLFLLSAGAIGDAAVRIARRLFPAASRLERATSATTLAIALGTTLLSILGMVGWMRPWPVAVGCGLAALMARAAGRLPCPTSASIPTAAAGCRSLLAYLPLILPVACFAAYLARAIAAPPRAWDGLTYHLTRAAQWVQDGGFVFHPAPDAWRYYDFFPPAGDLLFAFTFLAGQGDALLFLVYAGTMATLLLGSFALARALGAGASEASLAAAVVGTTPCVLHFGAVPYVDNFLLALVVLSATHAARAVRAEQSDRALALAALAAGSAAATKSTGWFLVVIVAVLAATLVYRRRATTTAQLGAFTLALVPAALWALHATYETGSPIYPLPLRLGPFELAQGNELFRVTHDATLVGGAPSGSVTPVFLRQLFVGSRYPGWAHLNFGLGIALALPLAVVGAVRAHTFPRPFLFLLLLVAVLPFAGVLSPLMVLERTIWSPVSGRLVSPIVVVAACLAAVPAGWFARIGLSACLLAALATCRPVGLLLAEFSMGASAIGIGVAWMIGLLLPVVAPMSGRLRIAMVGAVVLLSPWILGALDQARAAHRYDYFAALSRGETFDLHPVPIGDQYLVWQRLDAPRPQTVAFTASFAEGGHNAFRYPLYGRRLQNRVVYVPATQTGEVLETWRPPPPGSSPLDADVYADRLLEQRVDALVLVTPASPEAVVALARPDRFDVVFATPDRNCLILRPRPR